MCGIVAAIAQRDVTPILMEGLRRLEYRGYDSAGVSVVGESGLQRRRAVGKVQQLAEQIENNPVVGELGIAHTRWATHGEPAERNAHPMTSGKVSVVHNGIIENHAALRDELIAQGYTFSSETDTEVIAHLVARALKGADHLRGAVAEVVAGLDGAYALAVVFEDDPGKLILARKGSPLIIGVGIGEHFAASDVAALLPVTRRFAFLEEGDVAELGRDAFQVFDKNGDPITREVKESQLNAGATSKNGYRHFMLKEIFEQPQAVTDTWHGRVSETAVLPAALGPKAEEVLPKTKAVSIVACGTSYYAGSVARYWIESITGLPCNVELASEYRYRKPAVVDGTLFVTISQSGETADTLAALQYAKSVNHLGTMGVVNVPESSIVRESDFCLMTVAGPEIGVASTKAFTTQLVALQLFALMLGKLTGRLNGSVEAEAVKAIRSLGSRIESTLLMDDQIERLSEQFADKHNALFLGRGPMFPIAMEGALKLKEISYIHAEGYAAGELKHGPLALIDETMPVIAVAPNDELLEKLKSNLEVVRARGGELFVFADRDAGFSSAPGVTVLEMPHTADLTAPMVYTVALQLLSYHVAILKGTDVDQPRNLAKSVTVE